MEFKEVIDYGIQYVDVLDTESICGALVEITHILDDISRHLDDIDAGLGAGIFEISTMLDTETKRIEEERGE